MRGSCSRVAHVVPTIEACYEIVLRTGKVLRPGAEMRDQLADGAERTSRRRSAANTGSRPIGSPPPRPRAHRHAGGSTTPQPRGEVAGRPVWEGKNPRPFPVEDVPVNPGSELHQLRAYADHFDQSGAADPPGPQGAFSAFYHGSKLQGTYRYTTQ